MCGLINGDLSGLRKNMVKQRLICINSTLSIWKEEKFMELKFEWDEEKDRINR